MGGLLGDFGTEFLQPVFFENMGETGLLLWFWDVG